MGTKFIPSDIDHKKALEHLKLGMYELSRLDIGKSADEQETHLTNADYHFTEASKYLDGTYRYNPPAVI